MPNTKVRRRLALAIGSVTLAAAICYVVVGESDTLGRIFCAFLGLGLALAIAVPTGRPGLGMILSGALIGALRFASAMKFAYLEEPVLAPDLRYFLNANTLGIIRKYPILLDSLLAGLVITALVLPVLLWLESPNAWRGRQRWRIPASILACLPAALILWSNGPFRQVYAQTDWDYIAGASLNPVTSFVRSFTRMAVVLPAYRPGDAARMDWGHADRWSAAEKKRLPDIVMVLEESTVDPHAWAICDIPACSARMFQPDARTAASGPLEVHTYGGGTWTSEFALFTGLPTTLFGSAGIYAPFNLAPLMRDTVPILLKSRGYRTVAIYAMTRDFVNAGEAYKHYGFDEFHDGNDIGLQWTSSDSERVRKFADIYRRERASTGQPLFFMLMMLRQHGPHDFPLAKLPPPFNQPLFPKLDAATNRNLGNYLARLHGSDEGMSELEKVVLDGPRAAVLMHFGDHHPSFDGLERKLEPGGPLALRPFGSSITYFMIKTNLPIPSKHDYELLDVASLGGLVLDVAGVPKDAYFEANTLLRQRCSGRFTECIDAKALASYYAEIFDRLAVMDN